MDDLRSVDEFKDVKERLMRSICGVIGDYYGCDPRLLRPRTWKEPHLLKYSVDSPEPHCGVEMHYGEKSDFRAPRRKSQANRAFRAARSERCSQCMSGAELRVSSNRAFWCSSLANSTLLRPLLAPAELTVRRTRFTIPLPPNTRFADGCNVTWNLMLSRITDYDGGGTYIRTLGKTIKLHQGQVLVHPGELFHKGVDITRGTRYLAVCFVDGFDPEVADTSTNGDKHKKAERNTLTFFD